MLADWRQGMSISAFESRAVAGAATDPQRPDIYLIQLDGYPREDTLRRLFDFDNSPFVSALTRTDSVFLRTATRTTCTPS